MKTNAVTSAAITGAKAANSVEAVYWDSVFTRYGNGWTGGDGAISYKLPDGRSLWLWGDSFLDTVYPDRHRPVVGFIHNQVTTMDADGGNFKTYYGGTKQNPKFDIFCKRFNFLIFKRACKILSNNPHNGC